MGTLGSGDGLTGIGDLAAVFQVGTRRVSPPEIDLLADMPETLAENRLLYQAGALGLMTAAGTRPLAKFDRLPDCPEEERPVARASEEALVEAFALDLPKAVLEWAVMAARTGVVAPHRVLPELIELGRKHPDTVLPVLGVRGRWLAEIEGVAIEPTPPSPHLVRRHTDPDEFRSWLTAGYKKLDTRERQEAVAALGEKLGLADEPLLETALADRRKEIRMLAVDLLARLDGSRLRQTAAELADQAVKHEKSFLKERLNVELPDVEKLPAWLSKIGPENNFGPGAEAVRDMLSLVPPSRWGQPSKFLALASKSAFYGAVLDGVFLAAFRFSDQVWIDACFAECMTGLIEFDNDWGRRAARVTGAIFDRLLIDRIKDKNNWDNRVYSPLSLSKKPFSLSLTQAILAHYGDAIHPELALEVAYWFDPATANEILQSPDERFTGAAAEKLRKIARVRHRLLSSLNSPQKS